MMMSDDYEAGLRGGDYRGITLESSRTLPCAHDLANGVCLENTCRVRPPPKAWSLLTMVRRVGGRVGRLCRRGQYQSPASSRGETSPSLSVTEAEAL